MTQLWHGTFKEVHWELLGKVSSLMERDLWEERELEPEGVMNKEAERIESEGPT